MAALSFASPTRVLDRMRRMEEAELPSLPSIQPNFDGDSGVDTSEGYTEQQDGEDSMDATPHPNRRHPLTTSYLAPSVSRSSTISSNTPGPTYNQGASPNVSSSSTSSAPFPPLPTRASSTESPYIARRAGTSTPYNFAGRSRRMVSDDHDLSRSQTAAATPVTARYLGHSRISSDTHTPAHTHTQTPGGYGGDRSEQFHTPGEMSGSFGAEPIPSVPIPVSPEGSYKGGEAVEDVEAEQDEMDMEVEEDGDGEGELPLPSLPEILGAEQSVAHNDAGSFDEDNEGQGGASLDKGARDGDDEDNGDDRSMDSLPADTPLRRFSRNVVVDRPGRRSQSLLAGRQSMASKGGLASFSAPSGLQIPSPVSASPISLSLPSSETPGTQQRVPSLTKSDGSTDTSHVDAATTPEAPARYAPIATPSFSRSLHEDHSLEIIEHPTGTGTGTAPHADVSMTSNGSSRSRTSPTFRPAQMGNHHAGTPATTVYSTPGMAREPAQGPYGHDAPSTYRYEHTNTHEGLSDMTDRFQRSINTPFTPSPTQAGQSGHRSKTADFSTPRAPLNDSERRKSHVLAVLQSTGINRRQRTPHPLRRVSMSPADDSISEEGAGAGMSGARSIGRTPFSGRTPRAGGGAELERSSSAPNESILSIASSADLTTDRRAATHGNSRLSRGNTSFPTLLMSYHNGNNSGSGSGSGNGNTSMSSPYPSSSLRGTAAADRRADGIKIQKHLNAMNRQLLETNAELAREAEGWKEETVRLRGMLSEAGIEVEDVDPVALDKSRNDSFSGSVSGSGSRTGDASVSVNANANVKADETDNSRLELEQDSAQRLVASMSPEQNAAIMQELAEKMEQMQEVLMLKDEQIVELQDALAAVSPVHSGSFNSSGEKERDGDKLHLQQQLEQAEQEKADLHADFASKTAQHAQQFAEISEQFEEQVKGLQVKLDRAEEELLDLRQRVPAGLTDRSAESDERVEKLEDEVRVLQEELDARADELAELESKYAESADLAADLEGRLHDAETALAEARQELAEGHSAENAEAKEQDADRIAELEDQLRHAQVALDAHTAESTDLRAQVEELNAELGERNAEIEGLEGRLEVAELAAQPLRQSIANTSSVSAVRGGADNQDQGQGQDQDQTPKLTPADQANFVAAMEERLDEAYREIGRLKHELASSPQRKLTMEAKDARIKALEREKASLVARQAQALAYTPAKGSGVGGTGVGAGSPLGKMGSSSGAGARSGAGAAGAAPTPLFNKALSHLQHMRTPRTPGSMRELSWLNTTIGDANEPILRAQVEHLQTELDKVNGQLDSNFSRLEEAGLGSVALAEKLAAALARIGELEDEIRALILEGKDREEGREGLVGVYKQRQAKSDADKERLQDALAEVHEQLSTMQSDNTRERSRLIADVAALKKTLAEQNETSEKEIERMRLETIDALDAAHEDVEKAKQDAIASTQETAAARASADEANRRVGALEKELEKVKHEYDDLHRRHVRAAADSVPTWELQQKESTIKRLQVDLDSARADADASAARLARECSLLRTAEQEIESLKEERERVMREIKAFDADLKLQTTEARRLKAQLLVLKDNDSQVQRVREELAGLKAEREAERVRGKEEVQRVKREVEGLREEVEGLERWKVEHVCGGDTAKALDDQRARFKAQTRDLAAQIRYLKAKYTRESTFRNGLGLQKRYLLLLVGGMSLNEQATLKAIAQMGYPVQEPPRPKRTLKAVGIAVLSTIRARNAAESWRREREIKERAVASFAERRR